MAGSPGLSSHVPGTVPETATFPERGTKLMKDFYTKLFPERSRSRSGTRNMEQGTWPCSTFPASMPQAHAKASIAAGNFSRLPHRELNLKGSEARHCPMLKHYGPYKSPEPAAYQAWERTSTDNKSSKDSEILMVYLQIKIPESWPVVAPSWR